MILLLAAFHTKAQIAVKAETIHTMEGAAISNGVVLIKNGKIERVGTASQVNIPSGYQVLEAKVVTPGLVDGHTVVGLAGHLNAQGDQDQLEKSSPIQPELRAIDAYNAKEELVTFLRTHGITTIHTGHGPGAIISGQTMVAKTYNGTIETVTLIPDKMLAMTLGTAVSSNFSSPGTRAKSVAMLRAELVKAQAYIKRKAEKDASKHPPLDLKMEALMKLLNGEYKGLITANTAMDIQAALRLAEEFKFKLVLDGAAEAYQFIDEIKRSGAELIIHPTMARSGGDYKNMSMESAGILAKAGIPLSLQSGFEGYVPKTRVIRFEAAEAVKYGMDYQDALKSITINPAKILGLDGRLGSIKAGKDADLVLYDGDPFEYLTHVCMVIMDGKVVENLCEK
jgi:imidazolonepropionase-like amidohydrolase